MASYVITAPNGKKYKVTGQGSKEEALAHLQQQLGGQQPVPQQPPQPQQEQALPWYTPITSIPGNALDIATGLGEGVVNQVKSMAQNPMRMNPIGAVAGSLYDIGKPIYDNPQGAWDAVKKGASENFGTPTRAWNTLATHPVDVAMTLAPGLGVAAKGAKVAGLSRTANALKVAGEMTDPVNAITKPFAAVSDKFAGNAALREMRNAAPSFEDVASQKNAAYSTLENAGIQFDPQAYNQMLHDTAQKVGKFSEARAPLANDMMNQLVSHDGTAPSFSTVEEMLSSAKGILREPGASNADKAAAHHIVDNLNGFFDNAPLTTNGSIAPSDVSSLAGQARELARRHILARDLAEMERKAEWYVSGKESGMRNQAAAYGKRNGKGLTPEEDKALRKVAGREGIRDIIMKTGNGLSQHIVPGLLGGAGSTMGPYGAVAGYGLGLGVNQAARQASAALANKATRNLFKTILAGKNAQEAARLASKGKRLNNAAVRGILFGHMASPGTPTK